MWHACVVPWLIRICLLFVKQCTFEFISHISILVSLVLSSIVRLLAFSSFIRVISWSRYQLFSISSIESEGTLRSISTSRRRDQLWWRKAITVQPIKSRNVESSATSSVSIRLSYVVSMRIIRDKEGVRKGSGRGQEGGRRGGGTTGGRAGRGWQGDESSPK